MPTDCIKSGRWYEDEICGICIEKEYKKMGYETDREVYGDRKILEAVAIGSLCSEIIRQIYRIKRENKNEPTK